MSQTTKSEWDHARQQWSQLSLKRTDFLAFLEAQGFSTNLDADVGDSELDFAELFLVCACLRQVPGAGDVFTERYFARARPALASMQMSAAMSKDVEQNVWEKLFTGASPKILDYVGRGQLTALIKVIVVRRAVSELRKNKREVVCDLDELLAFPDQLCDPALEVVRADFKREFAIAFADSLTELSERDRNFLRLRFVEGLQIDQISLGSQNALYAFVGLGYVIGSIPPTKSISGPFAQRPLGDNHHRACDGSCQRNRYPLQCQCRRSGRSRPTRLDSLPGPGNRSKTSSL